MSYKIVYVNGPADGREEEFPDLPDACIKMLVPPTDIRNSVRETPSGIRLYLGTEYSYVFWKQVGTCMLYKVEEHGMDANEYQHLVLRTESNDFPAIKKRLTPGLVYALGIVLSGFVHKSEQIDAIKKHLFYGKKIHDEYINFLLTKKGLHEELRPSDQIVRLLHATLGLCTESGELTEYVGKHLRGEDMPMVEISKEFGDVAWYLAQGCSSLGVPLSVVLEQNIFKLKQRYGDKFTEDVAQKHDGQ